MLNKGNHSQMAAKFRLVKYHNLPINIVAGYKYYVYLPIITIFIQGVSVYL